MTHLADGVVNALRDDEAVGERERAHAAVCGKCQRALANAEAQRSAVSEALRVLDGPPLTAADVARARGRVEERLSRDTRAGRWSSRTGSSGGRGRSLRWAAGLVLVAVGGLSALPGSPLRRALQEEIEATRSRPGLESGASLAETTGISFEVGPEGVRFVIESTEPIDSLEVSWVEGPVAGITAPVGSGFRRAAGRVEARVAGGTVRVRIPRSGPRVAVEVDGRTFVVRDGDRVTVPVPAQDRSETRFLFTFGGS